MPQPLYPEHIYDPLRYKIAKEILQKEYRKLFLDLDDDAWSKIDTSINSWATNPDKYHLDDVVYLDFWDSFASVIEGVKLKPGFTRLVTAQNYSWSQQTIPIDQIKMTSFLYQLHKIPGLVANHNIAYADIRRALVNHPEVLAEQRQINDSFGTDPSQDKYPIIVRKVARTDHYDVFDGNRRALRALLYGKNTF